MPVPAVCLSPGLDRLRSRSFSCVASFSLQIVPAVGELSIERLAKYQTAAKITVLSVFFLSRSWCTWTLSWLLTAVHAGAGNPTPNRSVPSGCRSRLWLPLVYLLCGQSSHELFILVFLLIDINIGKITCYIVWLLWGEVAWPWFLGVAADGCASSFHGVGGKFKTWSTAWERSGLQIQVNWEPN